MGEVKTDEKNNKQGGVEDCDMSVLGRGVWGSNSRKAIRSCYKSLNFPKMHKNTQTIYGTPIIQTLRIFFWLRHWMVATK